MSEADLEDPPCPRSMTGEHSWTSARNQAVESGVICRHCHLLGEEDPERPGRLLEGGWTGHVDPPDAMLPEGQTAMLGAGPETT